MVLYDVPAPAKINLFLHVTGRRADGYHLLQTAFRFIDVQDYLSFDLRSDGQIVREQETLAGLTAENDLIMRAAHALQQATGCSLGVQIHCQKNIPAGAGLGGGSSDAATTLLALNRLWSLGLRRDQLMAIGMQLGADVPVFIFGQAAFAQGIGELLEPIQVPSHHYVLIKPPQHISTGDVFQHKSLTRDEGRVKVTDFTTWQANNTAYFGKNNLETLVSQMYPEIASLKNHLHVLGINARMTGSGSCFFAEVPSKHEALLTKQQISSKISQVADTAGLIEQTWVCSGLQDHPLRYWI
ncbi:4-(cytidine 5'-diphospho)-2-C-methyl-D-erythritol kinase [Alcaligenes endophyticus]|uniref:4-diphosphocytidyl-2-C-methyl-D-erythritol kinase n=1 Tax=Alcaligenes endophyticus TaxID=1929088 RepID=A0ABT8EGQ6_9BURK|nr:4-(cytidine 5'-diphospho)-2-C-methyl-D-erythritol kinase [Alcaligenes endophyticus]MCX5589863.1 4-(cytidine 5'-diphospho)-2-C-methyl-D-erythritol kinase [Alcaligenes endophyticus]MDN4120474.1 4-(cytidine 5'-diphospho)-2-C-methyl-D-erythritol kinase [Alcaligenes endophyticus]